MLSQFLETLLISLFNGARDRHPRPSTPATVQAPEEKRDDAVVLGVVIASGPDRAEQQATPVRLETDLRRRHCYLLGATGSGKTTALLTLLEADLAAGRGVCLLDARGDLVDRVLRRLAAAHDPEALAERLLLIDLRSQTEAGLRPPEECLVGFNPLSQAGADPYTRAFFVLDVLRQQFGAALGVQTEETMRNCLLALAMAGGTLLDIERLLTQGAFRRALLTRVPDTGVQRFFARFEALSAAQRLLWTTPILNKITPLTSRPTLQVLLGSPSSVSLRDHLDAHADAIVLVCLASDELFGAAQFVGSLIVSAVASAVMRADRPAHPPVFLYLDEFENFSGAGEQFQAIISEGRRFGLAAVLSHQASAQLEPGLRGLIRNVVATQMFFATGGLDADMLAGEIPSEASRAEVRNLLMGQAVGEALLTRRGHPTVRVRIRQTPDPPASGQAVRRLRQAALRAHGRPLQEVEAALAAREREADPPAQGQAGAGVVTPDASGGTETIEIRDLEPCIASVAVPAPELRARQEAANDSGASNRRSTAGTGAGPADPPGRPRGQKAARAVPGDESPE